MEHIFEGLAALFLWIFVAGLVAGAIVVGLIWWLVV